MKAEQLT